MNLRQLEIFVEVARHMSFSGAARRLHIAQSAASLAVKRLESDLGLRLLHRSSRRVELTSQGAAFLRRVEPAMVQLSLAGHDARTVDEELTGTVRLSVPAMVGQALLAKPLAAFALRHPGVMLSVGMGGALDIRRMVLEGATDLGVIAGADSRRGLGLRPLATLPVVVVTPMAERAKPAMTWAALLAHPLVTFPRGYHQRSLIELRARERGLKPRIAFESEHVPMLLEAVRCGVGLTTLPAVAAEGVRSVACLALRENEVLDVCLCYRTAPAPGKAAAALAEFLEQHVEVRGG